MSTERTCITPGCGQRFELTDEEVQYYSGTIMDRQRSSPTYGEEIQMQLPKRCPECRAKKKAERQAQR